MKVPIKLWNAGLLSFDTAFKLQSALARNHLDSLDLNTNENHNTLLLVQHRPVYTIGIRDKIENSEIIHLKSLGAEFKKTNRGGLITFHGPGQLVVYPVINLKQFKPSVRWYVDRLEQTVIDLCSDYGLKATRSPHTGVWIRDNKIAAIGIHASRYITTHGIAINCNNDLTWFKHITPCGIEDKGVTSLTKELGSDCMIDSVAPKFLNRFSDVFNCHIDELSSNEQVLVLNKVYSNLLTVAQENP